MKRNLSGSIAISKLVHVRMKMKGKNGQPVEGVFIPIEANYLVKGKENALYMPIRVIVKDEEDQYGQHGFISQSVDSKVYKAASDDEKEKFNKLPILGNIKDFSNYSDDNSGQVSEETFTPESDNLPF